MSKIFFYLYICKCYFNRLIHLLWKKIKRKHGDESLFEITGSLSPPPVCLLNKTMKWSKSFISMRISMSCKGHTLGNLLVIKIYNINIKFIWTLQRARLNLNLTEN